jgi:hypothetical protein
MRGQLPTQSTLDAALVDATRAIVSEVDDGTLMLDVSDPQLLRDLIARLRIAEPTDPFHCMCFGDENITFEGQSGVLATITLHHGYSIRWDEAWGSDAALTDPMQLLSWLATQGLEAPLRGFEDDQRSAQESKRQRLLWEAAAPTALHPQLPELIARFGNPFSLFGDPEAANRVLDQAAETIESTYNEDEAATDLLTWYGSGRGPWSGYPGYEDLPLRLLLRLPTDAIVRSLETDLIDARRLEGAARLFASREFRQAREADLTALPTDLRQRLLAHVRSTGRPDNLSRAQAAFG